ncbi:MAG: hypothetical protein Q4A41_06220, partial [Bacillota bacterium]|nr:hypothetical protein [Bacillota bacterium]
EWLEKEIVAVRLKKAPDALARQHYVVVQGEEENPDTVGIPPMSDREKSVQKALTALKKEYPDGLSWNNENRKYVWKNIVPGIHQYTGYGCVAFAFEITDRVFTDSDKAVYQDRVSDIRRRIKVGDILRMDGDTHSVVVIDRNKNSIVVAEGNYNEAVHWGREISYEELERSLDYYYTRYH